MLHPNGGMWLDMVNSDSVECNIYSGGSKTAGKEDNCNKTMPPSRPSGYYRPKQSTVTA